MRKKVSKPDDPRIVVETTRKIRKDFKRKSHSDGFTMGGLILRWIREYLENK